MIKLNKRAWFGALITVAVFACGVALNACSQSFEVALTCEQFSPSFSAPTQMMPTSSAAVSVTFSTPLGTRYAVAWSSDRGEVLQPESEAQDGGADASDGAAEGTWTPLTEGPLAVTYVAPTTTGSAKVMATLTRIEGSDSSAPQSCTFSAPIMITDELDEADGGVDGSAEADGMADGGDEEAPE